MDFDHQFDMTLAHEITAPGPGNTDPWAWEKWVHFPMEIYLVQDPTISIDHKNDSGIKTLTAFPNPFAGSTHFEFHLNEPSYVELSVYNLQGKLVKSLIQQNLKACPPQGVYKTKWNGTDKNGKEVKSGLYLVRLKAGRQIMTRSVKIIK